MAFTSNNTRHLNSEILSILDEARTAASNSETGKASTLIAVASAYNQYINVTNDGFISERTHKEANRNPLVDNDD